MNISITKMIDGDRGNGGFTVIMRNTGHNSPSVGVWILEKNVARGFERRQPITVRRFERREPIRISRVERRQPITVRQLERRQPIRVRRVEPKRHRRRRCLQARTPLKQHSGRVNISVHKR